MFQKINAIIVLGIALAGCASTPTLIASGGSRSDATVEMSYEYTAFEVPKVDLEQGRIAAADRCKAWGYKDAEPFGGQTRSCNVMYNGGCSQWLATVTYQCMG